MRHLYVYFSKFMVQMHDTTSENGLLHNSWVMEGFKFNLQKYEFFKF